MERANLFSVDVDKDDGIIDHDMFILRRESAVVRAERRRLKEQLSKSLLKSVIGGASISNLFAILLLLMALCSLVIGLITYFESGTFSVPVGIMAGVGFVLAGVCFVIKTVLKKKGGADTVIDQLNDEYGELNKISERELGIPSDAKPVELFQYWHDEKGKYGDRYVNDTLSVFEERGNLCLYFGSAVIAVPIDSIEAVVKVRDKIFLSDWMKDEPDDGEEYRQYNIVRHRVDEYDENYSIDGYYSIRFTRDEITYEIIVPLYEIEPFLEILKLPVTEE